MVYLEGVANDHIIAEVQRRLDNIKDVDSILDGAAWNSTLRMRLSLFFGSWQHTERPDKVAASLLEGRVGVNCGWLAGCIAAAADVCTAAAVARRIITTGWPPAPLCGGSAIWDC